jgi:hypothetical protein
MRNQPLSGAEQKLVNEAAALLRPSERDLFMRNCAALFARSGDLPHAIRGALGGFGIACNAFRGRRHDR